MKIEIVITNNISEYFSVVFIETGKKQARSKQYICLRKKMGQRQNKKSASRGGEKEKVNKKDDTRERLCQLDRSTKQEDTGIAGQCLINF